MSFRIATCVFLLAAAGLGQDATDRPRELKRFDQLVGDWRGSGSVREHRGAEPMTWSSATRARWVLDRRFLQVDTEVDLGDAAPARLRMHALFGWDPRTGTYVSLQLDNEGTVALTEPAWVDERTLVYSTQFPRGRVPAVERTIVRVEDGRYTYRVERADGAEPFFTHVEGTVTRADEAPMPAAETAALLAPPSEEIERLHFLIGRWRVQGKVVPTPGAEPVEIAGEETITPWFRGQVLRAHLITEPDPDTGHRLEAVGFMAWNPHRRVFDHFVLDNAGRLGADIGMVQDERTLVITSGYAAQDGLQATRLILRLDKDGRAARLTVDRMSRDGKPDRAFDATYTRLDGR